MLNIHGVVSAPAFDDPLELLRACHERIQAQCATLRKLQPHLAAYGCDAQARQAAHTILRYFDTAGKHHHQDEEQDLFPYLLACRDAEAEALITRLLSEHAIMETAWLRLEPLLRAIVQGKATVLDGAAEVFLRAYHDHIALENGKLLPLAARLLTPMQLDLLGKHMAARRGVAHPTAGLPASTPKGQA